MEHHKQLKNPNTSELGFIKSINTLKYMKEIIELRIACIMLILGNLNK